MQKNISQKPSSMFFFGPCRIIHGPSRQRCASDALFSSIQQLEKLDGEKSESNRLAPPVNSRENHLFFLLCNCFNEVEGRASRFKL